MALFQAHWLGSPLWFWAVFFMIVTGLLIFDLGVLHRKNRVIKVRESLKLSGLYIGVALAFGGWVWWEMGGDSALDYLTGFVIEKTLAMDNIFVIAMIFSALSIPPQLQHRVLFWGVLGVILLRGVMIAMGVALVEAFDWMLYAFGIFLIWTGIKMGRSAGKEFEVRQSAVYRFILARLPVTNQLNGDRFFVRKEASDGERARWMVTPLFVALLMIEFIDIVFALDSIPAIFSITTDPFIIYTSNIFAILGLRALYFALAAMVRCFAYLTHALALLLVFIGSKIFIADLLGLAKFPPLLSLSITFAILGGGIGLSIWRQRSASS